MNYEKMICQGLNWTLACIPLILIFSSKASIFLFSLVVILLAALNWVRNGGNLFDKILSFFKENTLLKCALIFVVYAGLSNLWSLSPKQGLVILGFEIILPVLLMTVALSLNDKILTSIDFKFCAYGFVVAGLALVFETRTGMSLRQALGLRQWVGAMSHSGVTLALLAPVVFVWLSSFSKPKAYAFLAVVSVSVMMIVNDASKLALLGFIIAYFLYSNWLMSVRLFLFGILAIYIFLQPWIWSSLGADALSNTILAFKASAVHRLHIWETFSRLVLLNPWHGYGIASGHVLHNFDAIVAMIPQSLHQYVDAWHPHNNFLEIWLDLGLIGVVAFVLCLFLVFKGQWIVGRGCFASFMSIIAVGACSHGFWQGWWFAAICMMVLLYRVLDAKIENGLENQ